MNGKPGVLGSTEQSAAAIRLVGIIERIADEIYKEGGQYKDTCFASWHLRREWAACLRAALAAFRGDA